MTDFTPPLALPDDLLVRYVDDEASGEERVHVESFDGNSAVAARIWELREASAAFSAFLDELDVPGTPPLRARSRRAWRPGAKAAGIALLAITGSALAMPASRDSMARALGTVMEWVKGGSAEAPPSPATRVTVTVPDVAGELTIRLLRSQPQGLLAVTRVGGTAASVEVDATAQVVVLEGEILIRNSANSNADVRLDIPSGVSGLALIVEGVTSEVPLPGVSESVTVPLSGRTNR
jgi:hypothetical protein